jgi:trans-aconitate methyltransferase
VSEREKHWQSIYGSKPADAVSWYEREATASLAMIDACSLQRNDAIVDVGAGASVLVDGLIAKGHSDVTLLDVSEAALAITKSRVGDRAKYVACDVTRWKPVRAYALWHDRAVFHFLTEEESRAEYKETLAAALRKGGHAVIATFAEDGPEKCSGLSVRRYSAEELAAELAPGLAIVESRRVVHVTPWGAEQRFVYARFTANAKTT